MSKRELIEPTPSDKRNVRRDEPEGGHVRKGRAAASRTRERDAFKLALHGCADVFVDG
jgi:hypothetical protein